MIMACCGGKTKIQRVGQIARGYGNLAIGRKYEFTDDRIRACRECDEQTWMSKAEYAAWLAVHGIDVLKNFWQLQTLPKLPKYEHGRTRRNLFCRVCKCYVPAKARVKEAKCVLGKWA